MKVVSASIDSDHLGFMGEVPDHWCGSVIKDWAAPKITEGYDFNVMVGTYEGKPAWIVYEVP